MRIKLNLDSLAMMLFCARLKAYKEVPLTTDEWQMVEQTIRKKGLNGPASLLSMTRNELEDILEINEVSRETSISEDKFFLAKAPSVKSFE